MTRILVTGATGFVGSHAIEALMGAEGAETIAACRDPARLLPGFEGEVRQGDLEESDYVARAVRGVEVLVHAAAWTSAWGHAALSDAHFLAPSLALIDAAVAAGVRRVIFLSSTSVAAPGRSADPMSLAEAGRLGFWPHLRNVARIEAHMRDLAGRGGAEMTVLRVGLFAGRRYAIGLLPLLVPRLGTHLVPWVAGGRTTLPIVAGEDIGQAFALAALARRLPGYQGFNIVGPSKPRARAVIEHLAREYSLPAPHFSVPFPVARGFAHLMELIDPLVPWEPLVTRSVVHLMEETGATNTRARELLGYRPRVGWKEAIALQMEEMRAKQRGAMAMVRPLPGDR
ncbi:MAG: NAD(P)-dependent oxidoreductase [Paracoccaceae bacterium]